MSGGSSKQQTQQQQTSTNTINPQSMALLQGNYATAQQNAGLLAQPYTGQLTAGFTPTQLQAQGILSGVATNPTYQNTNNGAISSIQGVLGSNPNTTVAPQTVNAAQLSNTNLTPYENPYTSDVINTTMQQLNQQRGIAQSQDNAKAAAEGAFGGSRSGVANALTNQYYDQDAASTIAGLNQANYTQAQNAALADIQAQNNMGQFNSTQNVNAQQSSINNALAQAGFQVNAAGQLVQANNSALNTAATQGGILGAVGDAQQAQNQTELTNAYNAWLQGKQLTLDQQNLLNSALGMIPVQQTVNASSSGNTNTSSNSGLGGILGGLGSVAQGAGLLML